MLCQAICQNPHCGHVPSHQKKESYYLHFGTTGMYQWCLWAESRQKNHIICVLGTDKSVLSVVMAQTEEASQSSWVQSPEIYHNAYCRQSPGKREDSDQIVDGPGDISQCPLVLCDKSLFICSHGSDRGGKSNHLGTEPRDMLQCLL